jgi:hypothetical protein
MNVPGHKFALATFTAIIAMWLVAMAIIMRAGALPASASGTMLAVFNPGTPQEQIFASLINAGAKPIRKTSFGFIWVVAGEQAGLSGRLRAQGAIGNYRNLPLSPTIAGCFAFADAKLAAAFE